MKGTEKEKKYGLISKLRHLSKEEVKEMSSEEFRKAYEGGDSKTLEKYYVLAMLECFKKVPAKHPDHDAIIEEIAEESVVKMYEKLDEYEEEKSPFNYYFKGRVEFCRLEAFKQYGLEIAQSKKGGESEDEEETSTVVSSRRRIVLDSDRAYDGDDEEDNDIADISNPDSYTNPDAPMPAKFSKSMMPLIRGFAENFLDDIEKRIFCKGWGYAYMPDALSDEEYDENHYGYAKRLSEEFAKEGIYLTPDDIKKKLYQILQRVKKYLVKKTGISESEFKDNMRMFLIVDEKESAKDNVANVLAGLDVDTLSGDEAAWLFMQFFRRK